MDEYDSRDEMITDYITIWEEYNMDDYNKWEVECVVSICSRNELGTHGIFKYFCLGFGKS